MLPAFFLVYFLGAPVGWRRRLVDLTMATLVLAAVSLSWVLAYDLTPPDQRPFAGSSTTNSMPRVWRWTITASSGSSPAGRSFGPPGSIRGPGRQPRRVHNQVLALGPQPVPGFVEDGRGSGTASRRTAAARRSPSGRSSGVAAPVGDPGVVGCRASGAMASALAPAHGALILWVGWTLAYGIVYSYAGRDLSRLLPRDHGTSARGARRHRRCEPMGRIPPERMARRLASRRAAPDRGLGGLHRVEYPGVEARRVAPWSDGSPDRRERTVRRLADLALPRPSRRNPGGCGRPAYATAARPLEPSSAPPVLPARWWWDWWRCWSLLERGR